MKTRLLVVRSQPVGRRDVVRCAGAALALTLSCFPVRAFAATPLAVNPGTVVPPPIPVLPPGNQITAFSKDAIGETPQAPIQLKVCGSQITEEIAGLSFRLSMTPGPCDEPLSRSLLTGLLTATVDIVRRHADLRGCFTGKWQILSTSGAVLASGDIDGTVGSGSHRPPGTGPCEECHDPTHFEGRMIGTVAAQGPLQGAQICAMLAGTGPLQPNTPLRISIEGVVLSRCIPGVAAGG